jgi:hypothetical protein
MYSLYMSPPPLLPDTPDEITNTLALLLPSQQLFEPAILSVLRNHYEGYGRLAHWAPVRGFGRVILVYDEEEDAARAKREGDRLKLDAEGYFKG